MKIEDLEFIRDILAYGVLPMPGHDMDTARAIDLLRTEIIAKEHAKSLRKAKYLCATCDQNGHDYCKRPSLCPSAKGAQ
jgi:hypothetical protein